MTTGDGGAWVVPARQDGRIVFVADGHGGRIGVLSTEGTGVHACPVGGSSFLFFPSWLAALAWLKVKAAKR